MTKISILVTVSVTRLPKVPLVRRAGLIIDIWNLFVICYLFFEICYLPFGVLFTEIHN